MDGFIPRPPTEDEIKDLPHVMTNIPITAWLLVFIGSAAAFARYGVSTTFQNYIQNPPGNSQLPGALGLGQAKATTITSIFSVLVFIPPLPLGILSDGWLGRYRTMILSLGLLLLGYTVLVVMAIPASFRHGASLGGLGQDGLSAVMFVFIGDQIPDNGRTIQKNPKGKSVIQDRSISIQFATNFASPSIIGTAIRERISFWSADLMPTGILAISIIPLLLWSSRLTRPRLQKNVLPETLRVVYIACQNRFRLSAAVQAHHCDSVFADELRSGLNACRIMIAFVIFWLCYNQLLSNIVSQAGQMERVGVSNDTIVFFNVAAVVVLSHLIQSLQALLRRYRLSFGPIRRITVGFVLTAMAMAHAAGLQKLIYSRGPCYSRPLDCSGAYQNGHLRPNKVNVWLQAPINVLLGAGEILAYVSMTEYAYALSQNMKAVIQALNQLTVALGSALCTALGPASRDSWLVTLYSCLSGIMGLNAVLFWLVFRIRR
ncbi:oligopeptide transporter [Corynespora cassiicola Philippines]|uniref:Oligopeptide transporter n=1 Tax=Corynespora cassiicola Philippines TaxID=1448308 RepID=A0A2T2N2V0_CORCC|nr:oligopeptide transporter [Corynespora cassiicola Philippines]